LFLARIIHELATPTVDMNALPSVLEPSFGRLRTESPCDVLFKYASTSILDFGFWIFEYN
jgi:hypothetical protein